MDSPEQKLQGFRDRIDALDEQLAQLFIERIGIIREVAQLKAEHWPKACHIRPGREGEMHRAIANRFAGTGFPPLMALAIWRQMIGGSTHVESPLNVVHLRTHPEQQFLAREYFGIQVGSHAANSLTDALERIRAGHANILLLPTPDPDTPIQDSAAGGWWRQADQLRESGLFLFATLPVAAENVPQGYAPAVALAAITPEDSGDDVSYFFHPSSGKSTPARLEIVEGFHTTRKNAIFLGAHPRAVHFSEGVMHA